MTRATPADGAQNHEGPPASRDRARVGLMLVVASGAERDARPEIRTPSPPGERDRLRRAYRRVAGAFLALDVVFELDFLLDDFFFALQPATLTFDRTVFTAPL